ncbi:TorF family putative porin [Noviherbaspirillum aridicola]|uniref:Exported protein n=1 Tax=Noviherbaspirillum aridicola TaxID=2849687 RepID=A0ABQ4Q4R3_9BURK|nr:TorF family putative porin [Noviherbaspirillum aridicola]GIZ52182.1 exported protein [Noviherbaspirillum aridicola]
MKKMILAAAVLSAFAASASAQQAAASDHAFTGNVAVVTDYRFRGISQTFKRPAIQGGFDYAHSSGFYVGNWNSSISGNQYPDGAGVEMDLYGGYKFEVMPEVGIDVGLLKYYYPGVRIAGEKADALELYVGASWKWLSAKYSRSIDDEYFGFTDAKGSDYIELNANFEIMDKTVLGLHVGHQKFKNSGDFNYTDYKVGVTRDFGFATLGLAYVTTNADSDFYSPSNSSGTKTKDVSNGTVVLSLSKTF